MYLRADYTLQCYVGEHDSFVPVVAIFLFLFTFLFPVAVSVVLFRNRKKLYTAEVQHVIGFLYSRFTLNAEFWEIHEMFRKLLLMGVLVFFPPTTRAATAILICVVACCSVNYYKPHRNTIVLGVAQTAFLLSALKYVVAVLLMTESHIGPDDSNALGWFMIVLDCAFMVASLCSMVAIVWLLRVKLQEALVEAKGSTGTTSTETDFKSTKVMPK